MEWLLGLAIVPVLACGVMCVGGMALAAVGVRRRAARRACCDERGPADVAEPPRVRASR